MQQDRRPFAQEKFLIISDFEVSFTNSCDAQHNVIKCVTLMLYD